MRRFLPPALVLLFLSSCNSGGAGPPAAPSSPWPRFRHDSAHTGAGIGRVATPRATPLGVPVDATPPYSAVSSSPAIGIDGTAYALSEAGTLIAVRTDGTVKWRTAGCEACASGRQTFGRTLSSPTLFAPARGNPVVFFGSETGRVYAVEERGDHGACTLCFDALDGGPELATARFSAPVTLVTHIATGKVVQIVAPAAVRRPQSMTDEGVVFSISAAGDLLWRYPRSGTYGSAFVTPTALGISSTAIVGSADGRIHALSLLQAGEPLWSFDVGPLMDPEAAAALVPVTSGAAVFMGTTDGRVMALANDGRAVLWERTLRNARLAGSFALGVQGASVEAPTETPLRLATPTPTFRIPQPFSPTVPIGTPTVTPPTPSTTSTPTPTVTPLGLSSALFLVTKDGRFLAVDTRTGSDLPTGDVQPAVDGEVLSSPALSLDAYLVFPTTAGTLYALDNRTGSSAWPPVVLAAGVRIRSSPAIAADGTIWVGADNGFLYRIGGQ